MNPFSDNFILKTLLNYINPFSENFILNGVLEFLQFLNPFSEDFILKGVLQFLGNILSFLNPLSDNFLGKKIIELLGDLLKFLFVPSADSVLNLQNVFGDRLRFIDTIKTFISSVKDMSENVESLPKYTIDINSKYYKGSLTVLDLSWYSQFKSYGDLIITAFTYVFFIWRLWCRLPNILHGLGSSGDVVSSINEEKNKSSWYITGQKFLFKK